MRDLNELAVFAQVVETGSFTGAARVLGLPKATVSRRIAQLETRLGARLMHRTTRRIRLTELGEAYYQRCADIMREVEAANALVGTYLNEPRGLLRIAAPVSFGATILADWVGAYLNTHPGVEAEVLLANQYVDLVAEGIDIAFRVGPLQESSLVARKLGPVAYVVCAAPAYLARAGTPTAPDDLAGHACVRMIGLPQRNRWRFAGPAGAVEATVSGRVVANDMLFARRLALDGLGVSYLPSFLVAEDVRAGRLVHLLKAWSPPPREMFAVYPSRNYLSPKVRTFLDYVLDQVSPSAPWTMG